MINLKNFKFIDIIPPSIKDDIQVVAIAESLDQQLHEIVDSIIKTIILPRIDELDEDTIDILAWQFHVDFYEPLGLDLAKKKALVKNSISWHKRKGTKSVVEEIIALLFFEEFEIREWFEYDGEPYFFRLITTNNILHQDFYIELLRAIYSVKNTRSWLDMIKLLKEFKMYLKTAIFPSKYLKTYINCSKSKDCESKTKIIINSISSKHFKTYINCSKSKNCHSEINLATASVPIIHKQELLKSFKYRQNICSFSLNTSVLPILVKKIISIAKEVTL